MVTRNPFYRGWDPWRELNQLQHEMNRLFGREGNGSTLSPETPAVNVWRNENGVVLTAELPGLDPKDVDISVTGETVTIRGTRKPDEAQPNVKYHRRERIAGQFVRSLQLPFRVDSQKTEAKYDRGVLTVTLAALEEEKPKKITITAA
jgi:HSP20 family protein